MAQRNVKSSATQKESCEVNIMDGVFDGLQRTKQELDEAKKRKVFNGERLFDDLKISCK